MHRFARFEGKRRSHVIFAVIGAMASAALLAAWGFVARIGGLDRPAASVLLEFLTVFLVTFGTLFVVGWVTGLIPARRRRSRNPG